MAGYPPSRLDLFKWGFVLRAQGFGYWAARMEAATGRRRKRAGDGAFQQRGFARG
jgi:hypothetical protein